MADKQKLLDNKVFFWLAKYPNGIEARKLDNWHIMYETDESLKSVIASLNRLVKQGKAQVLKKSSTPSQTIYVKTVIEKNTNSTAKPTPKKKGFFARLFG